MNRRSDAKPAGASANFSPTAGYLVAVVLMVLGRALILVTPGGARCPCPAATFPPKPIVGLATIAFGVAIAGAVAVLRRRRSNREMNVSP